MRPRSRSAMFAFGRRVAVTVAASLMAFAAHAFVITISPIPVGGRVVSDEGGIDCPGTCVSSNLAIGTTLTATPDFGNVFEDWREGGLPFGFNSWVFVTGPDRTVTATFGIPPSFPGPASATVPVLVPIAASIPVAGAPAPTVIITSGTLPNGVSMSPNGTFTGTPAFGTMGVYPLTLNAFNIHGFTTGAFTLTVEKRAQTITFGAPPPATVLLSAGSVSLQAQATSALDVTYATTTPSVCTPNFFGVVLVAAGTCEVQVDQAGDATWSAAPQVLLSIAVQSAPLISSSNIAAFPVGQATQFQLAATGSPPPTISVTGTLPPGLAFDPATALIGGTALAGTVGAYPVVVTASNGVGANATQNLELNVAKGAQTITPTPAYRSGKLPSAPPFDIDAFSSALLPLSFSTSTPAICSVSGVRVTLTGVQGACTLTATQAGDASFLAATQATWSIVVDSARIDTIAGGGVLDGAAATVAVLNQPAAAAVRADGAVLIADKDHHRVRIVSGGIMSTFAGTGERGFSGDGSLATAARLDSPSGVAVDAAGNVYVADAGNHRIRRIAPNGVITTFAGSGVRALSGDGGAALAAGLSSPRGLALNAAGELHFIDGGRVVRKVAAGVVSTVAGNRVAGYAGDGALATLAAFREPQSLAFDPTGHLYVSDSSNFRVRRISAFTGVISTFAGTGVNSSAPDGSPATATALRPRGIAIDSSGRLLIAEGSVQKVRRVDAGIVGTTADGPAAGVFFQPESLAASSAGAFYAVSSLLGQVRLVSGSGTISPFANTSFTVFAGEGQPARQALIGSPKGMALDGSGNVYFVDDLSSVVRRISAAGILTTIAGNGTQGFSGDGGPASAAQLSNPRDVAIDAAGNLYIADYSNGRVRKVTPQGGITTYAGNGTMVGDSGDGGPATAAAIQPVALAIAPDGALHIASGARIRRVSAAGIITTVAGNGNYGSSGDGGPATAAELSAVGIAFDRAGNLLIGTFGSQRVRKVAPDGTISTIAGTGQPGYSGDGGPATSAKLLTPTIVGADPFGNVYFCDASNNVIRRIDAATGVITSFTVPQKLPFAGEAEPPSIATVGRPEGIVFDALGNFYLADTENSVIRKVTFDSQPAAFGFASQPGAASGSLRQSETITPAGYDAQAVVTVSGGGYSVGCAGTFTSAQGGILPGQTVCVRHVAAAGTGATVTTTLSIGGVAGTFSSTTANAPPPTDSPRLGNISTRMQVLTGNDVMIGGFVIGGSTTKRVAIVATGPSLAAFGITNALANPTLSLVRSSDQAVIATSDNWQTAANQADLTAAGFAPSNTLEAAILADLAPGAYTAIVSGAGGLTGVSVIGVYEVNHPEAPLINISTRGRVLTGNDVMIGGFVINGTAPKTLAIVATGPSLAAFGIASPLANPTISLVRSSDQAVIATNDDWQADSSAAQLQAAGFAPSNALESGLYRSLAPGAYTVIVQGAGGGTGVAVIGVYAVN